jgi:hypothetical protein
MAYVKMGQENSGPNRVVYGDDDRALPIAKTSERLPGMVKDLDRVVTAGGCTPSH